MQVVILRTWKHLVVEGWVEGRIGGKWKIAPAGRKVAGRATHQPAGPG